MSQTLSAFICHLGLGGGAHWCMLENSCEYWKEDGKIEYKQSSIGRQTIKRTKAHTHKYKIRLRDEPS